MKVKITETKVYEYDELTQEAKDTAIDNLIQFLLETSEPEDWSYNFKKAVDKAEEMQTPWFTGSYVYEYCLQELIDELKDNEYGFTEDGNIA